MQPMPSRTGIFFRRWLWLGLALPVLAGVAVLFQFDPARHAFYPTCVFHRVTGWNCPGCGGLRATHHLLHGDVAVAFGFNALVVLGAPVVLTLAARWLWVYWRGRRVPPRPVATFWIWGLLAVMVGFGIVRNLPGALFARLWP